MVIRRSGIGCFVHQHNAVGPAVRIQNTSDNGAATQNSHSSLKIPHSIRPARQQTLG
jgi:hypothetical protein